MTRTGLSNGSRPLPRIEYEDPWDTPVHRRDLVNIELTLDNLRRRVSELESLLGLNR